MNVVKLCPKCGSSNVRRTVETELITNIDASMHYYCMDCKYEGFMPDVEKSEIEKFRKQIKKSKV